MHPWTRSERAAYAVLAGAPDEVWAPEDVADVARLDHHEVDRTLRLFAAAGIVEAVRTGPRVAGYRWRPSMAYLFDSTVAEGEAGPVCGMPVKPDRTYAVIAGATTISFCSRRCLLIYE